MQHPNGEDRPSAVGGESRIANVVASAFRQVAVQQRRELQPLTEDLVLVDSGLDSLCFALIVAQLEEDLGLDPFSGLDDAFFPDSFGAFVQIRTASASTTFS